MFFLVILILLIDLPSECSSRFHYLSINENDIASRHLVTFNSPNPQTSYRIISPNLRKYFSIKNQNQLYTLESFDREDFCKKSLCSCLIPCSIELKILSQPESEILFLNLTINDLNDNLHYFDYTEIVLSIPENLNIRHRQCYRIPNVIDEDLFQTNQFNYRLIGDQNNLFEINEIFGNYLCLKVQNFSLDREQCDRYENLWIIVEDQLKQRAYMRIVIRVLDINDNSPKFLTNSTIIHINETFCGELICIEAYDPDEGDNGNIIYSFEHIDQILFNSIYLNNQTGCIQIIEPLIDLSNNHLFLTIVAQDLGFKMSSTFPTSHFLEIILEDINDQKPSIQIKQILYGIEILKNNSNINILENTIGILAIISIDDIDQGISGDVKLTFTVQSKSKIPQQAFQIKSNSNKHYKFELINSLDYEIESSFVIYFDAIDGGGESTRFILNILIDNQNDVGPKFERDNYYFIINIQTKLDFNSTIIGQVHANDDNYLIYSLNSDLFQINSQTGERNLIQFLSRNETDQIFILNISVTDGQFQSETNLTILIQDYNHSPIFEKEEYFIQIDENIPIRTNIGQIIATDKDLSSTPRGQLTYYLHSITSYSEYLFHITHQGDIILTRIPDAEEHQIHEFLVIVKDHGTPPLSNQTKLRIKINDINEYCPKLVNKSSSPYLFIDRQDSFKYNFSAFDDDISDQSNIKFRFISSPYSHLFDLNENGLFILKEFPSNIPLTIELEYSLSDQFLPKPCITKEKLIILIGETLNDCYYLLNQYQIELNHYQKSRLMREKTKNEEIRFIFLIFTFCTLIVLILILYFLFLLCRQCHQRERLIRTKSSYIINPSII